MMNEQLHTNSLLGDFKRKESTLAPFVIDKEKIAQNQVGLSEKLERAKQLEAKGKYKEALHVYREYQAEVLINPSIEKAREILGKENVHDHFAISKAFGLEQSQIPEPEPIPFSQEELENAKEQGYMLVYRISETLDGIPLTPMKMHELVNKVNEKNVLIYGIKLSHMWFNQNHEDCIHKETPQSGWALITKEVLPRTYEKNYLEQTQIIINHLQNQYIDQAETPSIIQEGIDEFNLKKEDLAQKIKRLKEDVTLSQAQERDAYIEISNLIINKYFRRSIAEVLFDLQVHKSDTKNTEKLLEGKFEWTNSVASNYSNIFVGNHGSDGIFSGLLTQPNDLSKRGALVSYRHGTL